MDRDEVEVHKDAKKERGQYPTIMTEQAWSIKGLLYGQKITPRLREQSGQSRTQDSLHLAARGASQKINSVTVLNSKIKIKKIKR